MNWNIGKTTVKERAIIGDTMLGVFADLERAEVLLETVLDEHFLDREQKPIAASDADWTRSMLHIVNGIIIDSIVTFYLTIGDDEEPRAAHYIEAAKTAKLARQCEIAYYNAQKKHPGATGKIADMEDADAIAAIKLLDAATSNKEASV